MALISRATREQDICVFIGRFQPLHAAHVAIILQALEYAEYVFVVVGSSFAARRPDSNPFIYEERAQMVGATLPKEVHDRIQLIPIPDSAYDTNEWNTNVYTSVMSRAEQVLGRQRVPKIALIGHSKDHSSFYLKLFSSRNWTSINVPSQRPLDATMIRDGFLSRDESVVEGMFKQAIERGDLLPGTVNWLRDFQKRDIYKELVDELAYYRSCHARWERESYPGSRNTVTADALIVQGDQILLVQRGEWPQKNTWAIPGGHLNTDETVYDCALREGYEETGIKVPKIIFEKAFVGQDYFDAPRRDPRGRYVDHCFMFRLEPQVPGYDTTKSADWNRARVLASLEPPKVRGMDDAKDAKWWNISELVPDMMFLDHYAIIKKMLKAHPVAAKD